jgi:hypothetical protein
MNYFHLDILIGFAGQIMNQIHKVNSRLTVRINGKITRQIMLVTDGFPSAELLAKFLVNYSVTTKPDYLKSEGAK